MRVAFALIIEWMGFLMVFVGEALVDITDEAALYERDGQ